MDCEQAKEFLRAHGFAFTEKPITEPENLAEMRALGSRAAPTLLIDGRRYIGFGLSEAMIRKALGVPKSS